MKNLQHQLQERGAFDRVVIVRGDLFEPQRFVNVNGRLHLCRQCIQTHPLVTNAASLCDDRFREVPAQTLAAKLRPHEKPFHFANACANFPQRRTAG